MTDLATYLDTRTETGLATAINALAAAAARMPCCRRSDRR